MSKKGFKSQASSSKVGFGSAGAALGSPFGRTAGSVLSYVYEPPDLSLISNSLIVVSLKNLQKKDSTTKAKAAEELQSYVTSLNDNKDALEDAFLDAWARLFPRTSIDNSRRVRQLTYCLHGSIVALCGKRFVKYMPATIGPWLAGLQDSDRPSARSAQESIVKTFPTKEKQQGVWESFQEQIVEYAAGAILKESPQTLSDERTVSPDDADSKYSRAIGGAVLTVMALLDTLPEDQIRKGEASYKELLHSDSIWTLASSKDSFLRGSVYRLLLPALGKYEYLQDIQTIGNQMIKGLDAEQTGSMTSFLKAMVLLSSTHPEIWMSLYTGSSKKPPSRRLSHFLRKGSQGGGADVWKQMEALLKLIPRSVILPDKEDGSKESHICSPIPMLESLKEGVTRRNEVRAHQKDAWLCYLQLVKRILSFIQEPDSPGEFVHKSVLPLVRHFVKPEIDSSEWSSNTGLDQQLVAVEAINVAFSHSPLALDEAIKALSNSLIEDLQMSLPEQAKDFSKSQDSMMTEYARWDGIRSSIVSAQVSELTTMFLKTARGELEAATSVLASRNGKPYSSAAALEMLAHHVERRNDSTDDVQKITDERKIILDELLSFTRDKLPSFMGSASSIYLLQLLHVLDQFGNLDDTWRACIERLVAAESSTGKAATFEYLASSEAWLKGGRIQALLHQTVLTNLKKTLGDDEGDWSLVNSAIRNPRVPDAVKEDILIKMADSLSISTETEQALQGFEKVAQQDGVAFHRILTTPRGSQLLSKLLYLSQEGDESVQIRATRLRGLANASISKDATNTPTSNPVLGIIRDGVTRAGEGTLSVEYLVSQALELIRAAPADQAGDVLRELLPDTTRWTEALRPFLEQPIDDALALMNPLGGAVYLLSNTTPPFRLETRNYDAEGRSTPLRIALFLSRVAKATDLFQVAADDSLLSTYLHISVTTQLASDHLSLLPMCPLFKRSSTVDETKIVDVVAEIQSFHASWIRRATKANGEWLNNALAESYDAAKGSSTASYYHARAYAATLLEIKELRRDSKAAEHDLSELSRVRKQPVFLSDIARVVGASQSDALTKLLNELIADLAHWDFERDPDKGLRKVIMLNTVLQIEDLPLEEIPPQRLVFFVQHVSIVVQSTVSKDIKSELLKALVVFLPFIKGIYGEFWESILSAISEALELEDNSISFLHVSLRLLSILSKLTASDDSNEDLEESWAEDKSKIANGLLLTLRRHADASDALNEPLKIVNSLLSRQISAFADLMKLEVEDMYPIMASESTTLQFSAYEVLHKAIPLAQEEVSLDAALSKEYAARLPEELLSLILETPTADDYLDLRHEPEIPSPLARYLLSWKLVFDHWTNASYKAQADYVASLKESSSLQPLLNLIFSLLITHRGKNPLDPTRLPSSIETYTPNPSTDPGTETHHLLTHLYYLTLLHAPHLAKDWHTNSCPRALKTPVETWTEKHISPLIIAAELAAVSAWIPPEISTTGDSTSAASADLTIKVSPRAREASASLPLDDTHLSIRILLPPAYPLSTITIATSNRVGIDERKWTSFLNVSRIVMNFSSSSQGLGCVVDGIAAWRSNVLSALRGQGECAICYSVVSEDRKVPDKRCATWGGAGCVMGERWKDREDGRKGKGGEGEKSVEE
ncbi:hypothetical protein MMC10_009722 [Thelotrema lepadinum]|nr:hypothetical protein [Thelotrema lepadinum]